MKPQSDCPVMSIEALRRVAQALVDHDDLNHREFDALYPELSEARSHDKMFTLMADMARAALAKVPK